MIQVLQERVDSLDDEVAAQSAANATQDTDVETLLLEIDSLTQQVAALEEDVIASAALAADAADAVAAMEATLPPELWMYDRNGVAKFRVLNSDGIMVDLGDGLTTIYSASEAIEDKLPKVDPSIMWFAEDNCAGPSYAYEVTPNFVYASAMTNGVAYYFPSNVAGAAVERRSRFNSNTDSCEPAGMPWTEWMYPMNATVAVDIDIYSVAGPVHLKLKE